ncbi:hypothetical protein [Treponema sp.]|uniref:hypothetical protein n=1 Tax=Treponema sp. TaxID=166 RepID=UPI003890C9CF
MKRLYGEDLIADLNRQIDNLQNAIKNRYERIDQGMTDMDDCFVSQHLEDRGIALCKQKISLIQAGGTDWFAEYATLDGILVKAKWVASKYHHGTTVLRAEMPDGSVVWTSATTAKGLAAKGLKRVSCLRPAWFEFRSNGSGLCGAMTGNYVIVPSDFNYATGEDASEDPLEIADI